jgi:spore maturation protein CgeB
MLIVGNRGGTNIGESLERAACQVGIETRVLESARAHYGPRWLRVLYRRLRESCPGRLRGFSEEVGAACRVFKPELLLTMGIAPLSPCELRRIGDLGVIRANYLTDDPWSPSHNAGWFLRALPEYDYIFNSRTANIEQLRAAGAERVHYLPFGYDPRHFFPVELSGDDASRFESDVFFAGGADADRAEYIGALARAGFQVALYGSYWQRFRATRGMTRGRADVPVLRKAIRGARTSLCLVRRSNRDGHSMRTYELAAAGACVVAERTSEHQAIYGEEGRTVLYFSDIDEMVAKVSYLLHHASERSRCSEAVHRQVTSQPNTYRDRLAQIVQAVEPAK